MDNKLIKHSALDGSRLDLSPSREHPPLGPFYTGLDAASAFFVMDIVRKLTKKVHMLSACFDCF